MTITYFANPVRAAREAMLDGRLAYIDTPKQGNRRPAGVTWCADNGCFTRKSFSEAGWFAWLERNAEFAADCMFATAPDVVGDAAATIERSLPWLPKIRALGYRAAFVAQDGLEDLVVPWDEFDALFIGGSTEWKLGEAARQLVAEAKSRGKWVHMGRVNSRKRLRYAASIGCDSADGTYLVFGPEKNLPKLLGWLDELRAETTNVVEEAEKAADERVEVAATAIANGWTPVDALHADGFVRGDETLSVIFTAAGRALHAVYALYPVGSAPDADPIERTAAAGPDVFAFALQAASAAPVDAFDVLAAI